MQRALIAWSIGATIGVAACSDNEGLNTARFTPVAVARLTGVATDAKGNALDSVRVFVALPNTVQAGYASAQAVTNSAGRYVIDVQRMSQLGDAPTPDTVRVTVSAGLLKRVTANSATTIVTTGSLLTFGRNGDAPPVQQLNIQFR